jgi:hypothetical protein
MTCSFCNCQLDGRNCQSCTLYNGAVVAQKFAAQEIAQQRDATARDAWLNEHGIFAWVRTKTGQVTMQLGSPEEAAPFVALTQAMRRIEKPWRKADWKAQLAEDRAKQAAAVKR